MISHVHKPPKPEPRVVLDLTRDEAQIFKGWINNPLVAVLPPSIVNDVYDALFEGVRECDEYSS